MPHIELAAEKLFFVFGFPITNSLIMTWVVVGLLLLGTYMLNRHLRTVPSGLQNLFEMVTSAFADMMQNIIGSRSVTERFVPIVLTIFLFVVINNWLGILPGVGTIGLYEQREGGRVLVPFFRSGAADLNTTLALGIVAVVLINAAGASVRGFGSHLSKFFTFRNPINTFVGLLELVAEFAKIISFSFRLFGNVFAGEVLLTIVAFLSPYGAPIPFLGLELFVGFIQALVFAMLTMVFISLAVAEHHSSPPESGRML